MSAFKAYDVRGRVPDELNESLAERIGFATAKLLGEGPVVLGEDARLTSPKLRAALSRGIRRAGKDVILIGECGTEEVYFQTFHRDAAGGIMTTASHNPMDYNGMKLVREGSRPISGDSGLNDIRDFALSSQPIVDADVKGVEQCDEDKSAYIDHLLSYVDLDSLKPLKIVTNAGNGTAGIVVDRLRDRVPFEFITLQHEPDGTFPNGIPNPLLPEGRAITSEAVIAHGADMGIAWDGDFDRCFFFDHTGEFVEGYYLVGLLAKSLLKKNPGSKIIHDPRLTWNTEEIVKASGGIPVMSKTGHAFIKERMRAEDAIYGGEMSAHHYFRDFAYCDSGMIPWLLIASLISTSGESLRNLIGDCTTRYPCSGEINFKVSDASAARSAVEYQFASLSPSVNTVDGYSADFGAWRLNLRSSNTEPLLRLNVETRGSQELLGQKLAEVAGIIENYCI